MGKESPVKLRN